MPPKKVKAYKILKDKHGTRFVTIENKRIKIPGTITDVAFIKWLIQYLGPRARRSSRYPRMSRDRRPKGKPAIQRAVTSQASQGLWRAIGREEAAIRAVPARAGDPLVEAILTGRIPG